MKFSLLPLAGLQLVRAAEVYQAIYSGEELDGSDGDAVIFLNKPDEANGGSDLIVGCNNNGQCARTLLHFNVDKLPDDAVITDVQMTLLPAAGVSPEDPSLTLNAHQITNKWSRTDTSSPDGERDTWLESLSGTAATTGDVTWKYAMYPDTEWDTEGGDVNANVMTSVESAGWNGRAGPLFFPMTDEFKNVVTGWIDGTIPNYGILVKRDTEDPADSRLRIFFHEVSGNKSYRSPKLLITYTSVSQPDQMPSNESGPGITLPGEPTKPPTTSAPTPAPSCPIDADTNVLIGGSVQHASIFLGNGDLSQDKGAFGVGIVHSDEILRGLLKFPIDMIPEGSVITCAEIILKTTGPCGPCKGLVDVEMHRILEDWTTTGTNDFLEQPQPLLYQVELQGAGANTGDVTWTHSSYDAANPSKGTYWETPGADIDNTVLSMEVDNERGQHKFPTSDEFVAVIQGIVDGTMDNHGFLFKTEESDAYVALKAEENSYKDYDTAYRLFHAEDAETEESRPRIIVHYTKGVRKMDTVENDGRSEVKSSATSVLSRKQRIVAAMLSIAFTALIF